MSGEGRRGQAAITLAEQKAAARGLEAEYQEHRHGCTECKPRHRCDYTQHLYTQIGEARRAIKTWFDPGPDQGKLF
jgi:hypothetical protein